MLRFKDGSKSLLNPTF